LSQEPPLQRLFERIHACGPRAVGHAVAELLDDLDAGPAAFDLIFAWQCLDPGICAAVGADRWPGDVVRLVPRIARTAS
jgi:hypothetical protein